MEHAEQAAQRGMDRATGAAERRHTGWVDEALRHLADFAARQVGGFLIEDARNYAETHGLASPPDERAWGSVVRLASKAGSIKSVGYARARSSNNSPKTLWSAA